MSEPYSDEVPTEPRVYWVRDRQTDCEMHGTCAGGGIWYINGGKYHGDAALVDFQFGPAIPTAAELAELREKAAMLDGLRACGLIDRLAEEHPRLIANAQRVLREWSLTPSDGALHDDVVANITYRERELPAIQAAMAKDANEQQKPSPYGWPREVGKDGE